MEETSKNRSIRASEIRHQNQNFRKHPEHE